MNNAHTELKFLILDFSQHTVQEVLSANTGIDLPHWAIEVLSFLSDFVVHDYVSCFTSGTTGPAKEIRFETKQLIAGANNTLSFFDLQKGDVALLPLSCSFIAGKMMVVRALVGRLILYVTAPALDLSKVLEKKFDFSVLIPSQIIPLLASENSEIITQFGQILLGGSALSESLVKDLMRHKVAAWLSFGMTETMSHFALRQLSPVPHSRYVCLKGFEISQDYNGQLLVKNDSLGIAEMQTNDVVKIFNDRSFIWRGRSDNMVNSAGIKLYPETIEQRIKVLYPDLVPFIIQGVSDDKLGQKLALYFEGDFFLTPEALLVLKEHLPPYECPRTYFSVNKFDRTLTGKIIRKKYN